MPSLVFYPFQQFTEDLPHKVHDFNSDDIKFTLSNTAPNSITDAVLADITQVSLANLAGSDQLFMTTSAQSSGIYTLDFADTNIRASGGDIGPFQYLIVYNDTPTSPLKPLICYFDYGSALTLTPGQFVNLVFSSSGLLTITHSP